ncbi:hypothetical protein HAX54_031852 [Datura stramonium]|uniref:Uncharacterized protein n=1 Tax=Datura stramonium TaxID=4076 RepID=A0ABS8VD08_DATST|nr:hypothetical protein [Datura stramonium]
MDLEARSGKGQGRAAKLRAPRWSRVTLPSRRQVLSHGEIELQNHERKRFKVNGHRVKAYLGKSEEIQLVDLWALGLKSKERTYGCTVWDVVNTNGPCYMFHRENSEAQEATKTTTSLPQSDEGSDEDEFDGDNPPTDNAEEGNGNADKGTGDAEESGDDDTEKEESADKESAAEKSNEQVGDSDPATKLEERSKRWFL